MTRNKKLILASALAGLVGTVAIIGAVQAHQERGGYGPGYARHHGMMGGHRGERNMMGGHRGERGLMGGHRGGGHGMIKRYIFELADADKDGKLTQAEIDVARDERFATYDADGNGKLSLDEFEGLFREITRPMTVRAFQRFDPDGDAAISKEEFDRPTAGIVERLDRDDDGALSRADRHHRRGDRSHMRRHHRDDRGDDRDDDKK